MDNLYVIANTYCREYGDKVFGWHPSVVKRYLRSYGYPQNNDNIVKVSRLARSMYTPCMLSLRDIKTLYNQSERWHSRDKVIKLTKEYYKKYSKPQRTLEERLREFKINAVKLYASAVLPRVANRQIEVSFGDTPSITYERVAAGRYSSRCNYTRYINKFNIVVRNNWKTNVYNNMCNFKFKYAFVLDAIPICDNVFWAKWCIFSKVNNRIVIKNCYGQMVIKKDQYVNFIYLENAQKEYESRKDTK